MNEMTLNGLLNSGRSWYAQNEADYLVVWVEGVTPVPEMIVNSTENFEAKLQYYAQAYNEDLTLKHNSNIKIVKYDVLTKAELVAYL